MENIIEEIRQNEINLLKEEREININDNIEFNKTFNNKGNIYNINNNKSQKLNSYSDYSLKYKPIFIKGKEKKDSKKNPKKNYETILVENSKNNSNINAPQLFNILNETQKQKSKEKRNLNELLFNKNKALLWYEILSSYDSYNKDKEKISIKENKSKDLSINKKENEIIQELNQMHESIIKQREIMNNANKKIEIKNYQDVLNNIMKQIKNVRKERQRENYIFQKRIEMLEENIGQNKLLKYKTPKKEINLLNNIYSSNKNRGNQKRYYNYMTKKDETNFGRFNSYNKDRKSKNLYNSYKNIHKGINYTMNKYNYSFNNTNKYMPKYFRKKLKEKNKNNINTKKNYFLQFYKKTMNEIKKLNKENELIEKKYKNMPLTSEQFNEIIIKKISKTGPIKEINYQNNRYLIKNKIKIISKKIIDDLLYEIIYDLMFIESQRSEKNNKLRLMSGFNDVCENLNNLNEQEKEMVSKNKNIYNIIIEQKQSKSYRNNYNYNLIPAKKNKNKVEISDNLIEVIDEDRLKLFEAMLLHGCFYSDFDIFEIYDEFVNEQTKIILDDEINYIVNKYELLVEKLCDEELKRAENEINEH